MKVDKSNRYDRQLRLWASTGQSNLEDSHICLVNATATGSEILKNLILPGIGKYTIIDDAKVTNDDLSGNFFLTADNIGQYRSTAVCQGLRELNEDSHGTSITDALENIDPSIWDNFNIVVISDYIDPIILHELKHLLFAKSIPLLVVNTVGFYGSINLMVDEVTVIETHASKMYDLRIDKPWPELLDYTNSIDFESLDDTEHSHIPYVIIFIKALQTWKQYHNDQPPSNLAEKREFKKFIQDKSRNFNFETNYIEAVASVHRAYQKTEIPSGLKTLFNHEKISDTHLTVETPFFWILIKSLKLFVELYEDVPLSGALPDMASDTNNYITLQNLYRDKSIKDKKIFIELVKTVLNDIGRLDGLTALELELINLFCKNCRDLHVSNGSNNLSTDKLLDQMLKSKSNEYDNDKYNQLAIYYGIMTFNNYIKLHNEVPKETKFDDFIKVFSETFNCEPDLPLSALKTFKEIVCHNSTRYHNLNSLIGGIASQEVLKLTTSQYIPLDNLFVFDGIRSQGERYKV